jgi:hypothetical protein
VQAVDITHKKVSHFACCVGWRKGMKYAYFDILSTTTRMQLNWRDSGSPSMKSIVATSHGSEGIGSGWSKPTGGGLSGLAS